MVISSSTLVNVAEDAEIRLIGLISDDDENFQEKCNVCISNGDVDELIKILLINDSDKLSTMIRNHITTSSSTTTESSGGGEDSIVTVVECNSSIALLAALILKCNASNIVSYTKTLIDIIINAGSSSKDSNNNNIIIINHKLNLLSILYNMLLPPSKCIVLTSMYQLAGTAFNNNNNNNNRTSNKFLDPDDSTLGKLLIIEEETNKPQLITILDTWDNNNNSDTEEDSGNGITIQDRRILFYTICNALNDTDKRKQLFWLLLINTYKQGDNIDTIAKDAVKNVTIGAIRDPITLYTQQRNILQQYAINVVLKNDEYKDLLELLTIIQEGTLSDYETFVKSSKNLQVFNKYNIEQNICEKNMRILSLVTLASEQTIEQEISYELIAKTLHIDNIENVETWVIATVNSGLVQCKLDQLQQKVLIEKIVIPRKFNILQYKILQKQLHTWKNNVSNVLLALKSQQTN